MGDKGMMPTNASGVFEPQTAYSSRMTYPPQSDTELKPCPVCGGNPYVAKNVLGYGIGCKKCRVQFGCYNETVDEAIREWNRRVKE